MGRGLRKSVGLLFQVDDQRLFFESLPFREFVEVIVHLFRRRSGIGRKRSFKSSHFRVSERPVWVKAAIQPGLTSALRPKAVIRLNLV